MYQELHKIGLVYTVLFSILSWRRVPGGWCENSYFYQTQGQSIAKLSPSPSEAGLSKLYNHGGTATATAKPPNRRRQTARASESTRLDFVGS